MRYPVQWGALLLMVLFFANVAFAEDVTETSGNAQINWTKKEMVFTGDGAPNLKAPNAASARLGAERAAQLSALRNALEALKGVKITAGQTVGDKMQANDGIRAEVEGVVRGFIVEETRYYSDGGVQRDLRIPLDGVLSQAILKDQLAPPAAPAPKAEPKPAEPAKVEAKQEPAKVEAKPEPAAPAPTPAPAAPAAPAPAAPAEKKAVVKSDVTGLVVVAKGFKVIPVMAPKILDESGKDVYDVTMVSSDKIDNGIASYFKENDAAKADNKVAAKPLVVTALRSPNSVDLVISNADAEKVRTLAQASPILSEGRVIIVKD